MIRAFVAWDADPSGTPRRISIEQEPLGHVTVTRRRVWYVW